MPVIYVSPSIRYPEPSTSGKLRDHPGRLSATDDNRHIATIAIACH
jgi:hypothetical protein